MKMIFMAIGSRGDIEPFIAKAEIFQSQGHEVICAFPEQFRDLTEGANLRFHSMGSEFLDMLQSPEGKIAMGGSGSLIKKIISYSKLAKSFVGISKKLVANSQQLIDGENPDRLLFHGKVIYGYIWGINNPGKAFLSTPIPYLFQQVKGKSHLAFNGNYGNLINKLTYKLADFGLMMTLKKNAKGLKLEEPISSKQFRKQIAEGNTIYTLSPSLFSRPNYWNDNVKIVGYLERNKNRNWEPSEELETFVAQHKKILFVTFGSMTNPEPLKKTRLILDILEKHQIPAILNLGEGGLEKPENYQSDLVYFVSRIPYDWVFPKMHAVIHHGGAGTTHLAIKYGCSSMIIPHIIDQFMWNKLLAENKLGPLGIKITKLSLARLEPKLLDLYTNESYKKEAEKVGAKMREENFETELIDFVEGK